MYICARCGEDSIHDLSEDEADDDRSESPSDHREHGWCHTCDDVRPVAE